ncbi:MAG: RNA methyltransferase [Candidatus Eremiobacteraeota bacterium]|nr:RNA methyltransferase [Candidatus Eremiobacteraeota bacterium]
MDAALDAGLTPSAVFAVSGRQPLVGAAVERASQAGAPVYAVDERTLHSLAQTREPQGVVAQVPFIERDASALAAIVPASGPGGVLVLDDLDDPGNAGTLIRSAEAFGACAVCVGPSSVEPYNDKLVRATMGAIFRVPIVRYADWPQFEAELKRLNFSLIAATAGAPDIRSIDAPKRCALILGNERRGLNAVPEGAIGLTVGIPQRTAAESLNVAVAGSILLYELSRCGLWLGTKQ